MARNRLLHPSKFAGQIVAVRANHFFIDPTYGDCLIADIADSERSWYGLVVRSGGLVNQWYPWIGAGPVVGVMGQSGAGYTTPWLLSPLPESQRSEVVDLLAVDHITAWGEKAA